MSSVAEAVPEVTPDTRSTIYLGMDVHKESFTSPCSRPKPGRRLQRSCETDPVPGS